jgi:hypothetical protein
MPEVNEGFGEMAATPLTTISWTQLENASLQPTEKAPEDWCFIVTPPGFLAASGQDQGMGAEDKSTATESLCQGSSFHRVAADT